MKKKIIVILSIIILTIIAVVILAKKDTIEETRDTLPYIIQGSTIIEKDIKKGMTIKDGSENEWVWIEVPKTKVFKTAKNETDYKAIKTDIKEYIKDYSSEKYDDIDISEKLLTSIYRYGGFWISRYEIGTELIRTEEEEQLSTPLSQPDKYVYNYVTWNQARETVGKMSENEYKSDLLYGFQWDLVCKFIEENGYTNQGEKITEEMINNNSSKWGNYYSSSFRIDRGKYSTNYGIDYKQAETEEIKKEYKNALFTTGASEQNKACNIYDFAGNVSEWTLENELNNQDWKTIRDGSFYFNYGGNDPVNGRYSIEESSRNNNYGFRACLIKLD